jgi:hypothetical protein
MLANVGYTMQKCLPMSKLKFKRVSPEYIKIIMNPKYRLNMSEELYGFRDFKYSSHLGISIIGIK